MRWRRSLRVRLTGAAGLLAAVLLSLAALATVRLVETAILGTRDALLEEEATTLATLGALPAEQLAPALRAVAAETDTGPEKFAAILGPRREVVVESGRIPRALHLQAQPLPQTVRMLTIGEDEDRFRVAAAPIETGGAVVIGTRTGDILRYVDAARWAIGIVAALLFVLFTTGAWMITGQATVEVERLTAEVATIEATSLDRRLTDRHTNEVRQLVEVLNRVFDRLDSAVAQLRRFTADAAHELRTPLAAVRARLEVGLAGAGESVPRECVVDALEQVDRLGHLAEDLLTLARVEGGSIEAATLDAVVDVSALVREVVDAWTPVAEEEHRAFTATIAPNLTTRGAELLLKRTVVNLLDNAFRHTPPGTAVDVVVQPADGELRIEITDRGPGLHPAARTHLFERFHHGPAGGTGLGLALAREIVERHGGRVTVSDVSPPPGTCARIVLRPA